MENEKRILGLRSNVFFLGLVSLINDFSSEMVYSIMPAFLTAVLGAPPVFVGFLEGFADALASFLKIYFGWLSDKIHKRKILSIMGYSLSTATRWFLALVSGFWQVFALRALDRVGKGLRDSPRDALLSESVGDGELGKSFGYHRAMDAIGTMLGPLAAVLFLFYFDGDYRLLFKIAFVVGILSVLTFFFVKDIKKPIIKIAPVKFNFSLKEYSGDFKAYLVSVFIFGMGVMPIPLLLLKSQDLGPKLFSIPLMYFIYSLAFVIFSIPAGKLADKIGDRKILSFGFLAAIFSYFILFYFQSFWGLVAGFAVFGIYSSMTDGVERALASKLVPHEKLATGQGFLNAAIGFSSLLAGLIGGFIWTGFGSSPALIFGIILMLLGLLVFTVVNGNKKSL